MQFEYGNNNEEELSEIEMWYMFSIHSLVLDRKANRWDAFVG